MSDILIKNFKMPKDCKDCCRLGFSRCPSETSDSLIPSDSGKPIGCPLVELPPHGELVQRSDILRLFDENKWSAREAVMNAPTVLEASDE